MDAFALLRYCSIFNARRRSTKPAAPYSGFDGPYFDLDFTSDSTDLSENGEDLRFSFESATGFRVLVLNLKSGEIEANDEKENQGKMLTVKFDLKRPLARDESNHLKGFKHDSETNSASGERNLRKEMPHKYINMLKPLYIRIEKMKLSGDYTPCTAAETPKRRSGVKSRNNLQAWVNVMREHLVKSRSTPPPKMGSSRREEVVVEDGIQGAILHCKSSFNSNTGNYSN